MVDVLMHRAWEAEGMGVTFRAKVTLGANVNAVVNTLVPAVKCRELAVTEIYVQPSCNRLYIIVWQNAEARVHDLHMSTFTVS